MSLSARSDFDFDDFNSEVDILVIKRDGTKEDYSQDKISNSIMQAALKVGGENYQLADDLAEQITDMLVEDNVRKVTSEELENLVKNLLIDEGHSSTATEYIIYSSKRNDVREMNSSLIKAYEDITFKSGEESDSKRENANINTDTAMGTMLKYGSEGAKMFNLMYLIKPEHAEAHKNGDIHIHDLDFFRLCWNCNHIPIDKLFKDGFNTGHGYLREPGNIRTAGALAAIAIQSDQNDMFGGQSIPLFDYYLAPYVALTYVKKLALKTAERLDLEDAEYKALRKELLEYQKKNKLLMHEEGISEIEKMLREFLDKHSIEYNDKAIKKIFENTYKEVYDETYQSMEAFIHNMNTLHSRAGSQVPFSSVNFGTDTSVEGRMITETFLLSAERGLGYGEIPIFPQLGGAA